MLALSSVRASDSWPSIAGPGFRLSRVPALGILMDTIGLEPVASIMPSVCGRASGMGPAVLHSRTSLCRFLFCPLVVRPKVVNAILGGGLAGVGHGARMPMVAPTNREPIRGIVGARRAMCCANVSSESESGA